MGFGHNKREKDRTALKILAWATRKMKIPLTKKEKTGGIICFGRKNKSLLLDISLR